MDFSLSIGEMLAILGAMAGLGGWMFRLHMNGAQRIASLEQAIQDAVRASAQAVGNLAEETRNSVAHLRELIKISSREGKEAFARLERTAETLRTDAEDFRERLARIESAVNGGTRR
ncbi:MAG: hypothetical protein ACE5HU_09200 [Acidobacteriota bacterium]